MMVLMIISRKGKFCIDEYWIKNENRGDSGLIIRILLILLVMLELLKTLFLSKNL